MSLMKRKRSRLLLRCGGAVLCVLSCVWMFASLVGAQTSIPKIARGETKTVPMVYEGRRSEFAPLIYTWNILGVASSDTPAGWSVSGTSSASVSVPMTAEIGGYELATFTKSDIWSGQFEVVAGPEPPPCPPGQHWDEAAGACVDDVPPPPNDCPPGQHWDETQQACVPDGGGDCPPGQHWDEATQTCVPDGGGNDCPPGTHWDEVAQACVPDGGGNDCPPGTHWDDVAQACVPDGGGCPEGQHWDEALQACVPDESTTTWSPNTPPGTLVNPDGSIAGYNGRMSKPQDQTEYVLADSVVGVPSGQAVPCEVEPATDHDKKSVTSGGQTTHTYPPDGAVTYQWSAVDASGAEVGGFASPSSRTTTWTAPATEGTYILRCKLDDPWMGAQTGVTAPEGGSKNDEHPQGGPPVVREVMVQVFKAIWTTPSDISGEIKAPKEDAFIAAGSIGACAAQGADMDTRTADGVAELRPDTPIYEWSSEPPGFTFTDPKGASTFTTEYKAPKTPGEYTIKCTIDDKPDDIPAGEGGTRDDKPLVLSVKVKVVAVAFAPDIKEEYGFDAWTRPREKPWKSVEAGATDKAWAAIKPPEAGTKVFFTSDLPDVATISPPQGTSATEAADVPGWATQQLAIGGVAAHQETEVHGRVPDAAGKIAGTMRVAVYPKRKLSVAVVLINEANGTINGANVDVVAIEERLKKVYKQAVVEWIAVTKLATGSVSFDLNGDGMLDTGTRDTGLKFGSEEQKKIMEAYRGQITGEDPSYDKIVFLVANGSHPDYWGVAEFNQPYAFVFVDNPRNPDGPSVVAHEIGHALGLAHEGDDDNIMHPTKHGDGGYADDAPWRLRYHQWNILNNAANNGPPQPPPP